jgi:HD-GYP domain-containing protein (c-di-GMP phosphodiesterase class II)
VVVFTTTSVVLLPWVLVAAFVPRGGVLWSLASAVVAIALSLTIAAGESAVWTRRSQARDLVFADLMLWRWLRRCWTERCLAQARDLYASARRAGPTVSIELLEDLSGRLEERDAYTHGHSRRVSRHARRIARAMRLPPAQIAKISTAATVHDVGKLHTPREILNNPGQLTDREFRIMKLHPGDGADMLADVGDPEIAAMVRHHHERIDGRGYPDGLAGEDIPLGARVIAVADTFDAVTSSRPYRRAATHRRALDILSREAGSQLDPAAVAAFLSCYSARRSVAWLAFAAAIPDRILLGLQSVSPSFGTGAIGATSILPTLGAAGVFALSPVLRHDALVKREAHRQAPVPGLRRSATPTSAAVAGAPRRHPRRAGGTRPVALNPRPVRVTGRTFPSAPRPGAPTTDAPPGAGPTGARQPAGAAGTPLPASGSSSTPGSPPTPGAPPAGTSPTPTSPAPSGGAGPEQPVSSPATVPSLPEVHLPKVEIDAEKVKVTVD